MQSKLSKLQKEILIYIYKNQKSLSDVMIENHTEEQMIEFEKRVGGKYVKRLTLLFDIAEEHNKMEGYRKISPLYHPTLFNSLNSLVKRKLIKILYQWKDPDIVIKKGTHFWDDVCGIILIPQQIKYTDNTICRETDCSLARTSYIQLTKEGIETARQLVDILC